jgi:hypothetical protein
MITSDRQLTITNKKIESLQVAVKKLSDEAKTKPLAKSAKIQTQALIKALQLEVFEYEDLKNRGFDAIELNDLSEIMLIPIKYRIAKRMTQESFAKEVEIPLRMIARYESEGYRNITGENFHKILQKLNLKLPGKLKEA